MAEGELPAGFEQFAEVAPDAMICVDGQGDIILVNSQTERLFGHPREDLLGKKIEVLIPKRYAPTHKGHRDSYMADPHVRPMGAGRELWALRKDGTEFPVEISLSPIIAEGGRLVAASIRDVTERKAAEAEAKKAAEQAQVVKHLQELDDFRTTFINAAAHELNTPLTPIGATLKVMSITDDPAVRKSSLVVLERSFKRMAVLIADLLDAARFQSGNLKITKVDVDSKEMLEEAVSAFEAAAAEEKITLKADLQGGITINCDRSRLVQIAYNLISNALKFTKEGGTITVTSGADDVWWFEVKDDGMGMTKEQLGKLFQPFARVHNTSIPGTGLGLYISQGFMEAHGGRIIASSEGLEKGATFRVEMPLA